MKVINLFIILSLVISTSCKEKQEREVIKLASAEDFKENIEGENVQLVDVRTPEEFTEGHIENAKNINFKLDDFLEKMLTLDKEKPVYLYCRSGGRSGNASKLLKENGFKQIIDLDGGILDWKAKGFKITTK